MQALRSFAVGCVLASAVLIAGAAPGRAESRTDQVRIAYIKPTDPHLLKVYDDARGRRTLERLQEFLSPFRLPRTVTFTFKSCDGEDDAFYFDYQITLCYELVNELQWASPKTMTDDGLLPHDAVAGPFFSTALHEFAHAFFDLHRTPLFGREEDAADQFAAYIILLLDKETADRLIRGAAYYYQIESNERKSRSSIDFASEHGTAEQRYYNMLCLAFGADPEYFSDLKSKDIIPDDRAVLCQDEYEQIEDAYKAVVLPHVDQDLAEKVWGKLVVRRK